MMIKWAEAKLLLKEGDILLFKASKNPFSISYWIAKASFGKYSHVSLANLTLEGEPYCIEYREFVGARNHPLIEELQNGHHIDVFRINRYVSSIEFSQEAGQFIEKTKEFTPAIAKSITDLAKDYVAKNGKYSYGIIWKISGILIPIYRLFVNKNPDLEHDTNKFVCSTFVAFLYRKKFADLVSGVEDTYTTPSDIAHSELLNYLFTIVKD